MSEETLIRNILKCDFSVIAYANSFSVYYFRNGKYTCTEVKNISDIIPFVIDTSLIGSMTINVWADYERIQVHIHTKKENEELDEDVSLEFLLENSTFGDKNE